MLRRYAEGQADLVTRRQCLAAGLTDSAIEWRIARQRWIRRAVGVYLVRPGRRDWALTAMTALLSSQGADSLAADAAFCGRSAARLWGLDARDPPVIEIVVPQRRSLASSTGVKIRRSMRWSGLVDDFADPARTTVVATVLDLARSGSAMDALATVARAMQKEQVSAQQVRQEIRNRGGHAYSKLLLAALPDLDDGVESGAELLYVRDVERAHRLPRGTRQLSSALGRGQRHDNGYPEYALIVEVDGQLGHEPWADRVKDGVRDRRLLGHAQATARVYFSDVALTPCQTAVELGEILRSRGWTGRVRPCRRATCVVPS